MKLRRKPQISVLTSQVIPIVGDAAIATANLIEGRLVPLLILDTSEHPQISELIRVHSQFGPGDVEIQWARLKYRDETVILRLDFKRPVEAVAILKFGIVKQWSLVDQILTAQCVYVQSGRPGDRFITTQGVPRIFVEVPETGFRAVWDPLLRRQIAKHLRGMGLRRQQAAVAADQAIAEVRGIGQIRMKGGSR